MSFNNHFVQLLKTKLLEIIEKNFLCELAYLSTLTIIAYFEHLITSDMYVTACCKNSDCRKLNV